MRLPSLSFSLRRLAVAGILAVAMAATLMGSGATTTSAQDGAVTTGVVVDIETSADALVGFSLIDAEGATARFEVTPSTSFGLENSVGERWVSDDGATDLSEALRRLRDQQRRQQQVSVTGPVDGTATSVVQAAPSNISSNLGYLFAAFALAWLAVMGYVIYLGQRQRILSREVSNLSEPTEADEDDA